MNTQQIHHHSTGRCTQVLLFVLFAMMLTIVNTHAQVLPKPGEGEKTGQQTEQSSENENTDLSKKKFVDEDGDGLRDQAVRKRGNRSEAVDERKQRNRRRDHFIDMDGDGINDNRCNGMGIMRGQRHGKAQVEQQ